MEPNKDALREGLLSRLPQPGNLAEYRREVNALLEKNEKRFRRETWGAVAVWIWAILFFMLAMEVPILYHGGKSVWTPKATAAALQVGAFAFLLLIYGAVELLKHFINRARVELLKETKQVQLQVLELHELVRRQGARPETR